jgi:hypothetical protein
VEEDLSNALGLRATAIVARIVAAHPEITQVFFGKPAVNPSFPKRCKLSVSDLQVVRLAEQQWRRQDYNFPFLDAVMMSLLRSEKISEGVLTGTTFHQGIAKTQFAITSELVSDQKVAELAQEIRPNMMFSLCSKVRLKDGSTRHIPMMDFHCSANKYSLSLVCKIAQRFGVGRGFVLATERSYHFYGIQLLSESDLASFLGRALLFSPIVDHVWISHQLIDMCCALRISASRAGSNVPRVVAVV